MTLDVTVGRYGGCVQRWTLLRGKRGQVRRRIRARRRVGGRPLSTTPRTISDAIENDDPAVDVCMERALPNLECSDDPCRSSSGKDSDDIPIGLRKNGFDRTLPLRNRFPDAFEVRDVGWAARARAPDRVPRRRRLRRRHRRRRRRLCSRHQR